MIFRVFGACPCPFLTLSRALDHLLACAPSRMDPPAPTRKETTPRKAFSSAVCIFKRGASPNRRFTKSFLKKETLRPKKQRRIGHRASPTCCVLAAMVVAASSAAALHRMSSQLVAAVERHSVRVRPAGAPIHAADGELLFSLLGELRLDSHEPLLRELPSVAPGTTPCPADVGAAVDLRAFVGAVGASAAANPLLCILAERLSSSAVPSELDDESAYQLVHHCLLLDLVTRALAADPELAAAVYARARGTVHATEGWWP